MGNVFLFLREQVNEKKKTFISTMNEEVHPESEPELNSPSFDVSIYLEKLFGTLSDKERQELFQQYDTNYEKLIMWLADICGHEMEWQKYVMYELLTEIQCHHQPSLLLEMMSQKHILWNHNHFTSIQSRFQEQDDFIENPGEIEEGLFECRKCKSRRTFSFSKQTRRSDEGTTVFVRCAECQTTFKMN